MLVIALIGMAKRLPLPYTVWALISIIPALVTPFSGEALRSLPRFVAVLFLVAMWLGDALTREGRRLLAPARRRARLPPIREPAPVSRPARSPLLVGDRLARELVADVLARV